MDYEGRTISQIKASLESSIAACDWRGAMLAREAFLEAAARAHESFETAREELAELDARIDDAARPELAFEDALESARGKTRTQASGAGDAAGASSPELDAEVPWSLAELGFAVENAAWRDVRALANRVAASVRAARVIPPGLAERVRDLARVFESARLRAEEGARPLAARALALLAGREASADIAESMRACLESSAGLLRPTEVQDLEHLRGRVLFETQARHELGELTTAFARALADGEWARARQCERRLEPLVETLAHVPAALATRLQRAREGGERIKVAGRTAGSSARSSLRLLLDLGLPDFVPDAAATWLAERSWFFDADVIEDLQGMHAEARSLLEARARSRASLDELARRPAALDRSSVEALHARIRRTALEAREDAAMTEYRLRHARRVAGASPG